MLYVFSPDEPGLRIVINGKMRRFNNGRMTLEDGDPAAEWFRQKVLDTPYGSLPKFIVTDTLDSATLVRVLSERVGRAMAHRANAQDPATIQVDTEIQLNVMLQREGPTTERVMSQSELIRMLASNTGNRLASRPDFTTPPVAVPGINSGDLTADRKRDDDVIAEALRNAGGSESLDEITPGNRDPRAGSTEQDAPVPPAGNQDPRDPGVFGVVSN